MGSSGSPLVSVVIPVHNGEAFIADAIRSVLAQTHDNFDLTIANNCSTDRTAEIAEEFARQDERVHVYNATEFVSVVDSHNRAFTLISDDATYCQALGADDWLYPNALEEMVKVGEAYPTVGMITSYFLSGAGIRFGPPFPISFFPGREICRHRLLHGPYAFGGPSASLLRAQAVREKRFFYSPLRYHGDIDAYLDLLQKYDFGFVHQVLSFHRRGDDSPTTSYMDRVGAYAAHRMDEVSRFGPIYLSKQEFKGRLRAAKHEYYTLLARAIFDLRGREFWDFHLKFSRDLGYPLSYARLGLYAMLRVGDVAFNPLRSVINAIRRFSSLFTREKRLAAPAALPASALAPAPASPAAAASMKISTG